ncbi:hypothetical protein [Methylophaga pinxianii]|uniref:hypothetical protein n=1 Tax=Methylophaga pinxianii TaxID=2881052 RepID=UPI001CF4C6F7|nr:hypothetical protein [Methylophaga pinxianii]MCB2427678.1 hypothetical protein [Methylophaga pinxianii]UPH46181.1 hypothetical protein LGT42_002550 [Methylophaga pinxianii]
MADRRPQQLIESIKARINDNDEALAEALDKLQADVLAGKTKATIASLRGYCNLSEGAIRKRGWAILRLKSIKQGAKGRKSIAGPIVKVKTEVQLLKDRVRQLLAENAVLYEEILGMEELISRRGREIQILENRLKIKSDNCKDK